MVGKISEHVIRKIKLFKNIDCKKIDSGNKEHVFMLLKDLLLADDNDKIKISCVSLLFRHFSKRSIPIFKQALILVNNNTELLRVLKKYSCKLDPMNEVEIKQAYQEKMETITARIITEMLENISVNENEVITENEFEDGKWKTHIFHNVFNYFKEYLYYDSGMDNIFQRFCKQDFNYYKSNKELGHVFAKHLEKITPLVDDFKIIREENTFRYDNHFNKDFRFSHIRLNRKDYIITSIHLAGDNRVNNSRPRVFKFKRDYNEFFARWNYFTCSCQCGYIGGITMDGGNTWDADAGNVDCVFDASKKRTICPKYKEELNYSSLKGENSFFTEDSPNMIQKY